MIGLPKTIEAGDPGVVAELAVRGLGVAVLPVSLAHGRPAGHVERPLPPSLLSTLCREVADDLLRSQTGQEVP